MIVYIFGNGNISYKNFFLQYELPIFDLVVKDAHFIVCDFRGADILAIELLKTETGNVSLYHIGDKPRYFPDKFKTKVSQWKLVGGFSSNEERDNAAIDSCTHFLAIDFNSDRKRESGTKKNIERCLELGKISLL